jgi:DNA methylase
LKSSTTQYWTNEKTLELVTAEQSGIRGEENRDWEWRIISGKRKKVNLWSGHDYYFEQQFEAYDKVLDRWGGDKKKLTDNLKGAEYEPAHRERDMRPNSQGRNKRCVWTIPTEPFPEAHFATYPQGLCETPIKAACPEFVCRKCGKGKKKLYQGRSGAAFNLRIRDAKLRPEKWEGSKNLAIASEAEKESYDESQYGGEGKKFIGYTDCGCNAGFSPGEVLDPFAGSGTTGLVCQRLGRQFIGVDLSIEYLKMAQRRMAQEVMV